MKTVLGWVVNWGEIVGKDRPINVPNVTVDLFFTDRNTFEELWTCQNPECEILVPVNVPDDFDHLDFIPDNY